MNNIIIEEFQKLIKTIQYDLDTKALNDKEKTQNIFRLKSLKNNLNIIKKYPIKITLDNVDELKKFSGIGNGTIKRIKEILTTGRIAEAKNFKEDKNTKLIEKLETIVGVGHKIALALIKKGVKSISDLKKKIKNKEILVSDKIKIGVKYYGKFFGNIPRQEITDIKEILNNIIDSMNKELKLSEKTKYIMEICGSYRREKPTSGDIDVLISKYTDINFNHLQYFVNKLKQNHKQNDNQPLLIDDITDKHYTTKYMGFIKYKNNLIRRIDIRYIPWKYYYSALLYFTGSAEFNQKIRKIAKMKGYKLSEYGLTKITDQTEIKINSEKDVFDILKIPYLEPKSR